MPRRSFGYLVHKIMAMIGSVILVAASIGDLFPIAEADLEAEVMFLAGVSAFRIRELRELKDIRDLCLHSVAKDLPILTASSCYLYAERLNGLAKYDSALNYYGYALKGIEKLKHHRIRRIDVVLDSSFINFIASFPKIRQELPRIIDTYGYKITITPGLLGELAKVVEGDIYLGMGRAKYYKVSYGLDPERIDLFYSTLSDAERDYKKAVVSYMEMFLPGVKDTFNFPNPKLGRAYLHLAALYKLRGEIQRSDSLYTKASDNLGNVAAWYFALVSDRFPDMERAKPYIRKAKLYTLLSLEPLLKRIKYDYGKLADTYLMLGKIALVEGNMRLALSTYRRVNTLSLSYASEYLDTVVSDYLCFLNEEGCGDGWVQAMLRTAGKRYERFNKAEAYGMLAETYELKGDLRRAVRYYGRMAEVYLNYGRRIRERKTKKKLKNLIDYLKKYTYLNSPSGAQVLLAAGEIYDALGYHHVALSYYRKALKIYSDCSKERDKGETYFHIWRSFLIRGDYAKAFRYRDSITRTDSLRAGDLHFGTGRYYEARKDYSRAVEYYLRALKAYSSLKGSLKLVKMIATTERLIETYEKQGKYGKMKDLYRSLFLSYQRLGELEGDTAYYSKALETYERHLKDDTLKEVLGSSALLYLISAKFYREKGDYRRAIEYYRKFLDTYERTGDTSTDLRNVYADLGVLYSQIGKEDEAKRYYKAAGLEIRPEDRILATAEAYLQECMKGGPKGACGKAEELLTKLGPPYRYRLYEVYFALATYHLHNRPKEYVERMLKAVSLADSLRTVCLSGNVPKGIDCDDFHHARNPLFLLYYYLALNYSRWAEEVSNRRRDSLFFTYVRLSEEYALRAKEAATSPYVSDAEGVGDALEDIYFLLGNLYYTAALYKSREGLKRFEREADARIKRYKDETVKEAKSVSRYDFVGDNMYKEITDSLNKAKDKVVYKTPKEEDLYRYVILKSRWREYSIRRWMTSFREKRVIQLMKKEIEAGFKSGRGMILMVDGRPYLSKAINSFVQGLKYAQMGYFKEPEDPKTLFQFHDQLAIVGPDMNVPAMKVANLSCRKDMDIGPEDGELYIAITPSVCERIKRLPYDYLNSPAWTGFFFNALHYDIVAEQVGLNTGYSLLILFASPNESLKQYSTLLHRPYTSRKAEVSERMGEISSLLGLRKDAEQLCAVAYDEDLVEGERCYRHLYWLYIRKGYYGQLR